MLKTKLAHYKIILGSASPRRSFLMKGLDVPFEISIIYCDECVPDHISAEHSAEYLAIRKAAHFKRPLAENELLITADTIVLLHGDRIEKPSGRPEAVAMLNRLSGNRHDVITGVCLKGAEKQDAFSCKTAVWFNTLSDDAIDYYIDHYQPFDKAGSYGVQEWIGYVAIQRIDGDFYNVMGLPVSTLVEHLIHF